MATGMGHTDFVVGEEEQLWQLWKSEFYPIAAGYIEQGIWG